VANKKQQLSGSPNAGAKKFWDVSESDSNVQQTRSVVLAVTPADLKKDDWRLVELKKSKNNKREKNPGERIKMGMNLSNKRRCQKLTKEIQVLTLMG
jgi:hypothetical protein